MQQRPWFFLLCLAILTPLIFACGANSSTTSDGDDDTAGKTTTFILVRHAEKQGGDDPELTEAGQARAEDLARELKNEKIVAVYSTDTKRTQATAAPTARAFGLQVQSYDAGNLSAFAETVKKKYPGKTVLIVGHSNTTPTLADKLAGGDEFPRISEDDFGNIYRIKINRRGKIRTNQDRY
ncbi:SixA phosphatase family protein [Neolewinella antarctica]|uniref:Broad specificity phosphatase PhoE n=1 Tax=Neolewinella antarctica TaxID=442734 RepID=A0ABX0X6D3_9BACT|nr:phosphoglycerate mutase family protein [Neolewinella antarctica]NJC24697.1 broad specificity phosphatase PhoE [Neolewinella antarctica]